MSAAAEYRRRQRARRLATCRHFTGIQNDTCGAGVEYRSVRDTSGPGMARWPCTGDDCPIVCEKKSAFTAEEVDAQERRLTETLAHIGAARAAIVKTGQQSGRVDCPRCGGKGALRFTVSGCNGHVHAACKTTECLAWME